MGFNPTRIIELWARDAYSGPTGGAFPPFLAGFGSGYAVPHLRYGNSLAPAAYWDFYVWGSSGTAPNVDVYWHSASGTSSTVRWDVAMAWMLPGVDATSVWIGSMTGMSPIAATGFVRGVAQAPLKTSFAMAGATGFRDGAVIRMRVRRVAGGTGDLGAPANLERCVVSWV